MKITILLLALLLSSCAGHHKKSCNKSEAPVTTEAAAEQGLKTCEGKLNKDGSKCNCEQKLGGKCKAPATDAPDPWFNKKL